MRHHTSTVNPGDARGRGCTRGCHATFQPLRRPGPGFALAALLFVAAVVRLLWIGRESYWFDELWSIDQVRPPLGDVLASLAERDVHPPLYPLLLWGWVHLFGDAEWVTRLPSALFGTAAVGVLYVLGRDLWDRATGLVAAGMLALSSFAVAYSQETRCYSLLLLLSLGATAALVRWSASPRALGRQAGYTALGLLLAYTHVYGAFLLAAHAVFVLGWLPALRRRYLVTGAIVAVLFAPWVPVLLQQVGRVQAGFWIEPLTWRSSLTLTWFWGGYSYPMAATVGVLMLRGVLERAPEEPEPARRHRRGLALLLIAVPFALGVGVSLLFQPIVQPKYLIALLGGAFLLAARGLLALPVRWRVATGAAVGAAMAIALPLHTYVGASKEQWRELGALGRDAASRGTLVVAEACNRAFLPFYLGDTPVTWLETEADVDAVDWVARASGRDVLFLQVHPQGPDRRPALSRRWRTIDEIELKDARATRYHPLPRVNRE